MQLPLSLLAVVLLGATSTAQKTGPNGKRICVGGAISCQYEKGRCANICGDSFVNGQGTPAFIDPNCSCPEGQADNKYTGAACIDVEEGRPKLPMKAEKINGNMGEMSFGLSGGLSAREGWDMVQNGEE
ncbi:hypothetical protein CGCF415_v006294 [Colletotrichum fructicola]|nr:hypothetical protein CFRS1_v009382 [Colletotrichum fructicola]KAF4883385.1 hypothetical protein CGCFRS4_v013642 [Colletotrichum fructicola]KAF4909024.1 hypothetical protein CGCF415_v006294 [Colletotrichum fructicola]KAF4937754.1 hypothetical protein CGCF245_v005295 [Colletotrichum fructicola]